MKRQVLFKFLSTLTVLFKVTIVQGGNLALGQPAVMSSIYTNSPPPPTADKAVDGNPRGIHPHGALTNWSKNPWWRVDLGRSYVIDDVYIIGRSDCCADRINGAVITVGDDVNGMLNTKCASIEGVVSALKKSFKCASPLRGRYVTIYIPGQNKILALYEVMVNENPTANLAKRKQTSQSSLLTSPVGYSSQAVDGNRDGNYNILSCMCTLPENYPWWRVDFGSSLPVSEVFLVNRDSVRERLVNIEIRVGDSLTDNGNVNPRCGGIYSMATLFKASFYCKPRKTGRYVNIRLAADSMKLTLCEVEVYSESKAIFRNRPTNPTKINVIQRLSPRMTCPEPFGYPVPSVSWFRDGVLVQNNTNSIILDDKTMLNQLNDSVWECVVTNKHGSDFNQFVVEGSFKMCAKYEDLTVTDWSVNIQSRSLSNSSINNDTWYRLTDGHNYLQLPETCVSPLHCSTQATGWIQGSHPSKQDLVVERTVCFSWHGNCCKYNMAVLVRCCHGYFVYKLKETAFDVQVGYCTVQSSLNDHPMMFQSGTSDHALLNHVTNTERGLSMIECISVCLSNASCKSANHDAQTQICEMNNATRPESHDEDWKERPGNQYYELIELIS